METPASLIESLYERVEAYGKTTFELAKLKVFEKITHVMISLISKFGVIIMLSLFALVLSTGIALLLGELLGKSYYGFFIVAAFYFVAGLLLHFFLRRWIKKPVGDLIVKQALQ
jgi:Zn-dependent protease with chaperone function